MSQLDGYNMMIVSKYFKDIKDFATLIFVCKKFSDTAVKFHFNPIPLTRETLKFFPHIETLFLYSIKDPILRDGNIQRYFANFTCSVWGYKFYLSHGVECRDVGFFYKDCLSEEPPAIPKVVSSFNPYCFSRHAMPTIIVTKNIRRVAELSFATANVRNVVFENLITDLPFGTFLNCNHLTNITLPQTITSIQNLCFCGCMFSSIKIPDGVVYMGEQCFSHCIKLREIHFPPKVTKIENYSFIGNDALYFIDFKNISEIGESAFYKCKSLHNIEFGKSVKKLGESCFSNCTNLVSVRFPITLTSIGSLAFSKCKLQLVDIDYTLEDNREVRFVQENVVFQHNKTLLSFYCNNPDIKVNGINVIQNTHFVISNAILCLSNYCFSNCFDITEMVIPSSVSKIKNDCFYRCAKLHKVIFMENRQSDLILGQNAFYSCAQLSVINVPKELTRVGQKCFSQCNFSIFDFQKSTKIKSIKAFTFENDKMLTSIQIPSTITKIGQYAFCGCEKLQIFLFPTQLHKIENNCFSHCNLTALDFAPLHNLTSIGASSFSFCSSLRQISMGSVLTKLPDNCFENCVLLSAIEIPQNVTYLGNRCFSYCYSLKSVVLPDNLRFVGHHCFSCCAVQNVIWPSIASVPNFCYYNCRNLESFTFAEQQNASITIGIASFYNCIALKRVLLSKNVTEICDFAFSNCKKILTFSIPQSVTYLSSFCFEEPNDMSALFIGF
ncbi:hypothetical protein EIN_015440 [Entamoeba invadens IP1]|uniref:hypothetical protein n=1 Tax=Entamoeba invadens IP1 TaxID=370355 RepID=UPI0002C3EB04|nr:hypothetical protein EIN_015440 [Entamoeba invadens IP1]ELP90385.1 hypothetical protein EIN_015440 [Entamoeba invadens IP1]|eukprot:XP_004257156.1 hypothetical protein EIN_015440 [Entamoeba invadens IP1]